jgi:hypothetical protein
MPGLEPGIHAATLRHWFKTFFFPRHVDGRIKSGHDDDYRPLRSFARLCVLCGESLFQRQEGAKQYGVMPGHDDDYRPLRVFAVKSFCFSVASHLALIIPRKRESCWIIPSGPGLGRRGRGLLRRFRRKEKCEPDRPRQAGRSRLSSAGGRR